MFFKEYFVRDNMLWKRLADGSEIIVTGTRLAILVDDHDKRVLEHGAERQVRNTRHLILASQKHLRPQRLVIASRSIDTIDAADCKTLNEAIRNGKLEATLSIMGAAEWTTAA